MSRPQRYALNKNKYLLDPEVDRLEYLLKSHLSSDPRNSLILLSALHTGARARELLNAKFEDLNPYDETFFIHGIKGSNDREIPLHPWLFKELYRLKEASLGNKIKTDPKLIFPLSYQRLRQIWDIYRPVEKKFHSLRHTFAIRLFKKTKDLRLVQVALGHRNITNTMVYADYIYSQQELRRLIL